MSESSNTGNSRKPGTFKKGDPRINRKGRPKSFDALRALAQQIAQEAVTKDGKPLEINGHVATNIEVVLRAMMQDKRTAQQFVEIAFGKVPQAVEVSGVGGEPIQFVIQGADPNKL